MKLTPLDIRHKEFKRGMRGYSDVEVDEFLDEVADEYERLFKENIDLQERVENLEEKVAGYKRIEETLQQTLINAQASAEEQKQNASKQAQLVLQDAELKARQLVNEAYSERQAIEQSMAKLRSSEEDFRFKFRTLLEGYLRQLQETPEVVAAAPPAADFTRHAEAIKEAIARESAPEAPASVREPAPKQPQPHEAPEDVVDRRPDEAPEASSQRVETHVPPEPAASRTDDVRPAAPEHPVRGPGGIQAGRPRAAEPPADDPEVTAATPAPSQDATDEGRERSERIIFGESDDLLADVDTGVNENEFKW
ncbi:MAG: DivIVA domain-containing protein [Actinobacteria bacterium]|nr:DivIVA domain-containing protein [Actinomycetota bacterium]